ncbi:hypothetical protein C7271_02945 [filamentous cyanobacterium CCP5]|nr:hypothetical protein C7271_02945 [filamentous cyanobacterium CCP5]
MAQKQAIRALLLALDDWRGAIAAFKHGGSDLASKAQQVRAAGAKVSDLLEDAAVATAIETLVKTAKTEFPQRLDSFHEELQRQPEPILTRELESLKPLSCSRKDLETLMQAYCEGPKHPPKLPRPDQLETYFISLQTAMLEDLQASRWLSRTQKKRRKRKIATGILFTTCGIGLLAGNTLMDWEYAATSYILGGNALMQAVQDLTGEESP